MIRIVFLILLIFSFSGKAFSQDKIQKKAIQEAKKLKDKKEYDNAVRVLKNANEPQSMEVLDELAKILHLKKDYLEEIRALEIIKADGNISASQLVRLGDAYMNINKKDQVVENYRAAIKKAPKYQKAYQGLYEFYLNEKNYYDAKSMIGEIINRFGVKKYWQNQLCRMELEQQFFDTAKDVCQQAIIKDPKKAENHVYLALAFKGSGADDQARKIIFKAAQQFPKSEMTQWNAGLLSSSIQNWELSEKHYSQCIKADRKSLRCFYELGKVQFHLGKYDVALKNLKKGCSYIKDVDVEIRKFSYELEKMKKTNTAREYEKEVDSCKSIWFGSAKKGTNSRR